MSELPSRALLEPNMVIRNRWRIRHKLGQGAFGETYAADDKLTSQCVAIKVEPCNSKKPVLKLEATVLKKLQSSSYVCRYISCGRFRECNYLVMELLGQNLSDLRRARPSGTFSLSTTALLGLQILNAIENIHDSGYLHRDIKPSNFAIGCEVDQVLGWRVAYMIDFGLARKFCTNSGKIKEARPSTGFRGTARYASVNSHLAKELCRRDDLWSLFYMLIEFIKGKLPWRKEKDRTVIGQMKIARHNASLVAGCPSQLLWMKEYLDRLDYYDRPDYEFLRGLLRDLMENSGLATIQYDWERPERYNVLRVPEFSSNGESNVALMEDGSRMVHDNGGDDIVVAAGSDSNGQVQNSPSQPAETTRSDETESCDIPPLLLTYVDTQSTPVQSSASSSSVFATLQPTDTNDNDNNAMHINTIKSHNNNNNNNNNNNKDGPGLHVNTTIAPSPLMFLPYFRSVFDQDVSPSPSSSSPATVYSLSSSSQPVHAMPTMPRLPRDRPQSMARTTSMPVRSSPHVPTRIISAPPITPSPIYSSGPVHPFFSPLSAWPTWSSSSSSLLTSSRNYNNIQASHEHDNSRISTPPPMIPLHHETPEPFLYHQNVHASGHSSFNAMPEVAANDGNYNWNTFEDQKQYRSPSKALQKLQEVIKHHGGFSKNRGGSISSSMTQTLTLTPSEELDPGLSGPIESDSGFSVAAAGNGESSSSSSSMSARATPDGMKRRRTQLF